MPAAPHRMDPSLIGPKVRADCSLFAAFCDAFRLYGPYRKVAYDQQNAKGLSFAALCARAVVLSRLFRRDSRPEEPVGLMLPTSCGMILAFWAAQYLGRVATMINFNAGATAVIAACATARIRTIYTSRFFVEKAGLGLLVETMVDAGVRVVFLEDMRKGLRLTDKAVGLGLRIMPHLARLFAKRCKPDDPAMILFTSGSEGVPKGVVLSHRNILSNIRQFTSVLDIGSWDRMFCCLPLFHSFGLTVGALLPLLTGMRTYFYPSPLHYHDVPRLIASFGATILLSTDTFLTGYARCGEATDFASLRYIVAGAEKLKAETRATWESRFGKTIFEGYGVTETSPVLSVNTPDRFRLGSVGPILPDIEVRLNPIEGIAEGAELWVKGPNVMLGYMTAEAPGAIQPPPDGWHNTGDIVALDADGFISIVGRLKRFAKVGGEMVSLTAIEQVVSQLWPGRLHAVVSVPHVRKGETLVLLTEQEEADLERLHEALRERGLTELSFPRTVVAGAKVPVLGSGKIDYIGAREAALKSA